jgi:L-cystine uptake protein TcyP (sodium:dicarboxylate symporter family)
MNPTIVGLIVFACTFGGVLFGMWLRAVLPEHHFDAESKDTIKLGIGLIATMTALVLGLVTASAKNSFDAVDSAVKQSAIQVLALDRVLARTLVAKTVKVQQWWAFWFIFCVYCTHVIFHKILAFIGFISYKCNHVRRDCS